MGHSKALYKERIATEAVGKKGGSEKEGEEEVRSKVGTAEQEELDTLYEEEIAAKKLEIEELAKKLMESTNSQRLLQKHIEETKAEIDSLRLATQLQKMDLTEGHKVLWKKTAHNSQS